MDSLFQDRFREGLRLDFLIVLILDHRSDKVGGHWRGNGEHNVVCVSAVLVVILEPFLIVCCGDSSFHPISSPWQCQSPYLLGSGWSNYNRNRSLIRFRDLFRPEFLVLEEFDRPSDIPWRQMDFFDLYFVFGASSEGKGVLTIMAAWFRVCVCYLKQCYMWILVAIRALRWNTI